MVSPGLHSGSIVLFSMIIGETFSGVISSFVPLAADLYRAAIYAFEPIVAIPKPSSVEPFQTT